MLLEKVFTSIIRNGLRVLSGELAMHEKLPGRTRNITSNAELADMHVLKIFPKMLTANRESPCVKRAVGWTQWAASIKELCAGSGLLVLRIRLT